MAATGDAMGMNMLSKVQPGSCSLRYSLGMNMLSKVQPGSCCKLCSFPYKSIFIAIFFRIIFLIVEDSIQNVLF